MNLGRIPSSLEKEFRLFFLDRGSVSVSDSYLDSFFHMLKLWGGCSAFARGKGHWTELWGAPDPPPKRSFTSGNLIAVYLNYRGWDEKRRANELQVARHVQTITAGLQRAAPGPLDYCMPLSPPDPQFGYIGLLNVGRTYAFCLAWTYIYYRHIVSLKYSKLSEIIT